MVRPHAVKTHRRNLAFHVKILSEKKLGWILWKLLRFFVYVLESTVDVCHVQVLHSLFGYASSYQHDAEALLNANCGDWESDQGYTKFGS